MLMMKKRYWWSIAFAGLALLLVGCGVTTAASGNCANPAVSPPTSAGSGVVIATDHSLYASDAAINVTITNHLTTSIYAWDHQAGCSILGLVIEQQSTWEPAAKDISYCPLGRMSVQVQIAPGKSYTATIHAGFAHPSTFPPGVYRLVLRYTTARGPGAEGAHPAVTATTIYSQNFIVEDCGITTPTSAPTSSSSSGGGTVTAGTPISLTPITSTPISLTPTR